MSVTLLPFSMVLVGGWLVWWGLRRRRSLGQVPTDWRRVAGTVIDVGDGVAVPPRIEYRTPDGRRLRVPGPLATPFAVGDEVSVLIDPADSKRARLDLTEQEAVRLVTLLLVTGTVLAVGGAIMGVFLLL
ncbi:DUF3592 domain-containing protein [Aeromicrobium fastidiosum]|uniref:DUF3592 domain-containing protein n=1 Tax=Aeromicrobium fastidiosum TaxID=52699 RepID=A0A641ATH7_9ACTN|nr:DUF3592 domain-containing protein [Aeromicrobium fastidiosum]KAA1380817.1 DUF3592 domain-containing protein [Aeromicrobium fastidiosum]MBP2390441.1 hypothetical protein [Aeromicrobium fastidiosum]